MIKSAPNAVLFAALACAMIADCAAPHAAAQSAPRPAVARIVVEEQGGVAFGSGALVDARGGYGLVVTNWHVVRDATGPIEVVFPSGFRSEARRLKLDQDWDLAALVIWRPPAAPLPLAAAAPRPGERLTICGFGSGSYREATGRCTDYYAPEVGMPHELVELSVEARQGDSGGPILNQRGEIAGVLFGAGQGTTLGSFGGRVGDFLASLAPGINARQASPSAAPEFDPAPPPVMVATNNARRQHTYAAPPSDAVVAANSAPTIPAWRDDLLPAAAPPLASIAPGAEPAPTNQMTTDTLPDAGPSAEQSPGTPFPAQGPAAPPLDRYGAQPFEPAAATGLSNKAQYNAALPDALAMPSWFETGKTLLAVIGAVFILLQFVRLAT
ncbi:MAG: trypsin-like peptidase domain-containing protein [Planctomycetota bacterium]